jgi:hypothetical protein
MAQFSQRPFCTTDFQILRSGVVSSFPEGIIVACCACHLDKAEFGVRLIEIRLRSSGERRRDAAFHSPVATGILARAEQGYEVDQIANDIGMSRQNVEHGSATR